MKALIPEIIYVCWCIFFAYVNYVQINIANDRVRHGINGIFHLAVCLYFGFVVFWMKGLAMLFIGRLFFDVPLNLFRGLKIGYVSPEPKSIVDQAEKFVFGNNGILPKVIYLLIIAGLLYLQIKNNS